MSIKVGTYNVLKTNKERYLLLALLFFTVVINYMDRINISVAASAVRGDLGLSKEAMGLIFSAWAWTYTAFQIPGGLVADRFHARILYPIILDRNGRARTYKLLGRAYWVSNFCWGF